MKTLFTIKLFYVGTQGISVWQSYTTSVSFVSEKYYDRKLYFLRIFQFCWITTNFILNRVHCMLLLIEIKGHLWKHAYEAKLQSRPLCFNNLCNMDSFSIFSQKINQGVIKKLLNFGWIWVILTHAPDHFKCDLCIF